MPKKFKGENTKAVDAKARKAAIQHETAEKRQREAEDALWADDDKSLAKKTQRKEDKEKKRLEQLERKKELAQLHDEEQDSLKSAKAKAPASAKVTRHQINSQRQALEAEEEKERLADKSVVVVDEEPLVENLNKLTVEGEARNVDEALQVLGTPGKGPVEDKNPEKRVKAAYQEFEDTRMPQLKSDNPNLRLSQLRQMLKKEWQKSPQNPLNARFLK